MFSQEFRPRELAASFQSFQNRLIRIKETRVPVILKTSKKWWGGGGGGDQLNFFKKKTN